MAVFCRSGAKHRHRIECGAASRNSLFGTEPTIQNVRREVWFRSKPDLAMTLLKDQV